MTQQKYENIMVAVDGSREAELAFEKGVNVALRNASRLTIAHVIDTRALQSVSTFDAEVYEDLQEEAQKLMTEYKEKAQKAGVKYHLSISSATLKWTYWSFVTKRKHSKNIKQVALMAVPRFTHNCKPKSLIRLA